MIYKIIFANQVTCIFYSPYAVYTYLVNSVYSENEDSEINDNYINASDAQKWCEAANPGDRYITKNYIIECLYSFNHM